MKHRSRLISEQQQEHAAEKQTHQQQTGREFATAEELLRFDASHTVVPPEIGLRLQKSSADLPKPKSAWWKRIFGGAS
jgi:hypothetical protein